MKMKTLLQIRFILAWNGMNFGDSLASSNDLAKAITQSVDMVYKACGELLFGYDLKNSVCRRCSRR